MASENDPKDPDLDFEAASQANIEQIEQCMPLNASVYFIAADRRRSASDPNSGPAFLKLSGSTVTPSIQGAEGINNDFSKPGNIAEFIATTSQKKTEPADNRMLILWGHGKGMMFLSNPTQAGTQPTSKGVQNAVGFVGALHGTLATLPQFEFTILGLDCCFMAHLETLYQMRRLAQYIIAGPSAIPAQSWPYDSIARLLEDDFGAEDDNQAIVQAIAGAARESFIEIGELDSPVLGVATEKLQAVIDALNSLGSHLATTIDFGDRDNPLLSAVVGARRAARGHFNAPDYVELESFLKGLIQRTADTPAITQDDGESIADLARKAARAVRRCLIEPAPIRGGSAPHSPTIWFPLQSGLYSREASDLYDSLDASRTEEPGGATIAGWAKFLRTYHGDPKGLGDAIGPESKEVKELLQIGVRGWTQSV
jgi:hypothetical protein